jgi:hypothetical protein
VFENRVFRRIFGLRRDEMAGGWRELHNEGLHILYSWSNIIRMMKSRKMRWAGHGTKGNAYRFFVGKPARKRPLARTRHRWEDNIKMDIRTIGWGGLDWSDLVQDERPVEGTCELGNEPLASIKCWEILD